MKPTIARIVIFTQAANEAPYNGSREHPAIVNHAWGNDETPRLNLTVFPDCAATQSRTSVPHKSRAAEGSMYWDWPERI